MKKIMIIMVCLLTVNCFSTKISATLVKVPEPIAHYTFEDHEKPYADQSGNGNDLYADGSLAPEIVDGIARFNGKNAVHSQLKAWDFSDRLVDFSYSLVVQVEQSTGLGSLISTGQGNSGGCSLLFDGNQKYLYIKSSSDLPTQILSMEKDNNGVFVRYTVSYDALRGIMYTYFNDVLIEKVFLDGLDMKSTSPFSIGATVLPNGNTTQGFVGCIDEVAVFDVALTKNQVLRLNGFEVEESEMLSDTSQEQLDTIPDTNDLLHSEPTGDSTIILIIIVATVALLAVIYMVFTAIRITRQNK